MSTPLVAPWDVSTRQTNEGFIRRTIKPALGHLEVRKVRGPIVDQLYARLKRCGDLSCTNRDTLTITALRGPDAELRRQRQDGTWTGPFRVPRSYLARNAELGYGGNVHVAQGRTVDTAHLLVTGSLSRQACTLA